MTTEDRNNWGDIARVIGGAAVIFALAVGAIFYIDPFGRSGFRTSLQVPNLPEREIGVSRAVDPAFDSAIVGNSTTLPMQPEILDRLTGLRFVSLSMSGSGAPGALAAARFFIRHHREAKALIVGMDDGWCTKGHDVEEGRPFPFWLYGSDLQYIAGLFAHASWELILTKPERGANRLDGYHPYDEIFREHDFDNIEVVKKRLGRSERPNVARYSPPYEFEPPQMLAQLISEYPSIRFLLFWTPRYLSMLPVEGTSAAAADAACKAQVAQIGAANIRIVNWSGPRPENLDPANFYEPNHYRDTLALKIEKEIAVALETSP